MALCGLMKTALLTLAILSAPLSVHAVDLDLLTDVKALERAFGLPSGMVVASWQKECSMRSVCPRGKAGEWGPMQIKDERAESAGCLPGWRKGLGNFRCAARILKQELVRCGRIKGAFTRYHLPANGCRRPSHYGTETYRILLTIWMQEARNSEIKLAMR